MSGKFYNEGARTSMWASEWGSPANSVYDETQSHISDCTADDARRGYSDSEKWDVKERMKRLFETQCYTDVTFYQKGSRNVSISAHRAVLAIGSPLFKKMLFGDDLKDTAGKKMEVQISNLPFGAFTNIVKYMYTDEVFFESDSLVQGILDGAKQFEIKPLITRCMQYFETMELTDQNVCSKLHMSITNKINLLKDRCIDFIQKNTLQVIKSTDFKNSFPATVRAICKLQSLNIRSEMELLEAVMSWLYCQPPMGRKQLLEPLLKCIRFLTFTVNELGDTLKMYPNLLTSDEGLKIMLYLYNPPKNPDFKSLPAWCNRNSASRCFYNEEPHVTNTEPNKDNIISDGKVSFPLRSDKGQSLVTELTSLLQMKCISGHHEITAIKLTFDKPISIKSAINSLFIKIHVHPGGFKVRENAQIVNSETVRVEFRKPVFVRPGDLIDVEAEARNVYLYKFLQYDDTCQGQANPHFKCCVSSRPKQGKLYFISEIEYGPQGRSRGYTRSHFKPQFGKK